MERVIIAGVDRSARSRVAADWAAREALRRGLPLRVVHVAPPENLDPVEHWPYRPDSVADHVVAELTARHPSLTVRAVSPAGAPVPELRGRRAREAELVVLGLRGEGQHLDAPGLDRGGAGHRVRGAAGAGAGPSRGVMCRGTRTP
ncbi:universal stress protein [Streptomyces sp. L7]